MTALAERRRRRTIGMLCGTLAVLIVVPILGYVGVQAVANSTGGKDALADNLPIVPFPSTPTAALATTDANGVLSSVTVFVLHPSGVGGSAISVPVTADVGFSDDARRSLRMVHAEGGPEATQTAIASLLVITINHYREATADEVAALLAPLAPFEVDLPAPVGAPAEPSSTDTESTDTESTDDTSASGDDTSASSDDGSDDEDGDPANTDPDSTDPDRTDPDRTDPDPTDRDGTGPDSTDAGSTVPSETIVPAGATSLDSAAAAAILTTTSGDSPESTRRPNLEALWAGVAAAVGPGTGAVAPTEVAPSSFDELVTRLLAGPLQTRGLSARALTGDANIERLDVEEVARAETLLVFGSIAPGSVSAPAPGLIFRIEAPPGYVAEVQRTIAKLLFLGGNVVSVDMTKEPQENTVFIVPDEINRAEAVATNMIFGDFTFEEPSVRIDWVDLTVVLGTDYLETVDVVEQ